MMVRDSRKYRQLNEEMDSEVDAIHEAFDSFKRFGLWAWQLKALAFILLMIDMLVVYLAIECRRRTTVCDHEAQALLLNIGGGSE